MIDYPSLACIELNSISLGFKYFDVSSASKITGGLNRFEKNTIKLLTANSPCKLSNLLETTVSNLQSLINHPNYISFKIPKRKGGTRDIYAPEGQLKTIQKNLNFFLQSYFLCVKPNEVHGFVMHPKSMHLNCNIVENAKMHSQKKYVLNIDLKDFFPSISAFQVKEMFLSQLFGYPEHISTALALLTTYEGKLPIGAPTSPVISNFICKKLDADLIEFAIQNNLTYSRYADDLTFSSNSKIEQDSMLGIRELIQQNKFKINEKKFRLQSSNRKQTVTGITVNEKVNVDRKKLKKIRAMLNEWKTQGLLNATIGHFPYSNAGLHIYYLKERFMNRLKGYIDFVGQVRGKNDLIYLRFKSQYKENMKCLKPSDPKDPFNPDYH